MIKWRKSRQDTEYKPGLNSRREHNAQRSYIGHAQRIKFGRPRPKFSAQNFKRRPPKENCFHAKYGNGKLETFRTYTFIDHRFPVDLLLCFELSLSKTLYGFQTPRLTRLSSYLYGNWGQLGFESLNAPFEKVGLVVGNWMIWGLSPHELNLVEVRFASSSLTPSYNRNDSDGKASLDGREH